MTSIRPFECKQNYSLYIIIKDKIVNFYIMTTQEENNHITHILGFYFIFHFSKKKTNGKLKLLQAKLTLTDK